MELDWVLNSVNRISRLSAKSDKGIYHIYKVFDERDLFFVDNNDVVYKLGTFIPTNNQTSLKEAKKMAEIHAYLDIEFHQKYKLNPL